MTDQEGVIKFQLSHLIASPLPLCQLTELIAWRRILYQLELIGEDPLRYNGCGFGNISQRIPHPDSSSRPFIITGTQTGGYKELGAEQFTTVTECIPEKNMVRSRGPVKPSSEAMTHAALYELDPEVQVVIHAHSPHIWRSAVRLGVPVTSVTAGFGTTAMVDAVREIMAQPLTRALGLFIMGGHEDGVVSFARTADQAGVALVSNLVRAYQYS